MLFRSPPSLPRTPPGNPTKEPDEYGMPTFKGVMLCNSASGPDMQCVCQWRAPWALVSPTPSPTPKNQSQCWVGGAPTKLRSGCYGGYRSVFRFCARIWFPMFEMCSQLFQFCCLARYSPPSVAPGAKIEPSQRPGTRCLPYILAVTIADKQTNRQTNKRTHTHTQTNKQTHTQTLFELIWPN